jgi:hypothetical protein
VDPAVSLAFALRGVARSANMPDDATGNTGRRVVADT